jgi:hypothetical protein
MQTSNPDPATRWALGASLALLAATLVGLLLGWLAGTRSVGGLYITFVMPLLLGSLIGGAAAFPARRVGFGEARPLIAAAILGALVAFVGQHVFAFLNFMELLASQNTNDVLVNAVADPIAAGLMHLERATGESGYFAYLAFTAKMPMAHASPIGMLGRLELGVGGTIAVAAVELVLLAGTAAFSVMWRTRSLRPQRSKGPVGLAFAGCDEETLLTVGKALDAANPVAAAAALRAYQPVRPRFGLHWRSAGDGIDIYELGPDGRRGALRAQRVLGLAQTRSFRDAVEGRSAPESF